jgi:hypothetical protein
MVFQVKAIRPRKRIDAEGFELAILAALREEGEIVKRMYEKTVRTWSSPKPVFKIEARIGAGGPRGGISSDSAIVNVFTTDQKYLWVDLGTQPYVIRPRNALFLRFTVGGRPKTRPRVIGSGAGSRGSQWVTTRLVRHPGIKAREFTDEITKRRRRPFLRNMEIAFQRAQKRYAW